jgi:predicted nucleic acid-binding protein
VRVFLDTNVLVSAYTARLGYCAELLELILTDPQCSLLTGEVNLSELRSVLRRRPFRVQPARIEEIESQLRDQIIIPKASLPRRSSGSGSRRPLGVGFSGRRPGGSVGHRR